jgi:hypothetical protein
VTSTIHYDLTLNGATTSKIQVVTSDGAGNATFYKSGYVPGSYTFKLTSIVFGDCTTAITDKTLLFDVYAILTPSVNIAITSGSNPSCSNNAVVFTATPTNVGTPSYQWKKGSVDVGTNSATYTDDGTTAGSITVVMTTSFRCSTIPTATSNIINLEVTSSGQWLGLTSDWDTESNWCGGIPTSSTNVLIPFEVPFQPVIGVTTTASCHDINIEGGAKLTIESDGSGTGSLIVSGGVSGAGSADVKRFMTTDIL